METTNRNRVTGEIRAFRDEEWLRLREEGKTIAELADEAGMSVRHVKRALSRARKERECRIRDTFDESASPSENLGGSESPPSSPRIPSWLELIPLFPVGPFTPASECPHRGPIPEGSLLCCMVCSTSGMDGHPALVRDPKTDPRPEPKPRRPSAPKSKTSPDAGKPKPATRRQRRRLAFGSATPPADATKIPSDS